MKFIVHRSSAKGEAKELDAEEEEWHVRSYGDSHTASRSASPSEDLLLLLTARDVVHVRKKVHNTKQQERASVKAWGTIKSRRAQNPNGRISAFAPLATEAGRNAALSSPRSFA